MPIKNNREYRAMPLMGSVIGKEKRLKSDYYVEGYATTFNDPYVLFEENGIQYKEVIDRNALVGADMSDIIMQYDHSGDVLARKSNGTLIVETDDKGIFIAADMGKSEAARRRYEEIQNGLVHQMSWAFTVAEDAYDRETHTRTILRIKKVYDVSAVSIPANPSTDIAARSYFDGEIEKEKQELLEREAHERQIRKIKLLMEVENFDKT